MVFPQPPVTHWISDGAAPVLPALHAEVILMPADPSQHLESYVLPYTLVARTKLLWLLAGSSSEKARKTSQGFSNFYLPKYLNSLLQQHAQHDFC